MTDARRDRQKARSQEWRQAGVKFGDDKCIHKPDGQRVKFLSVDANSPCFGRDLSIVFERNVAKAHKKKFGSSDSLAPNSSIAEVLDR